MEQPPNDTAPACGLSELNAGLGLRLFPVAHAKNGCAAFVRWDALDEQWAMQIHGQTLSRLAERGGLYPAEIFMNVNHLGIYEDVSDADALTLCRELAPNGEVRGASRPAGEASSREAATSTVVLERKETT